MVFKSYDAEFFVDILIGIGWSQTELAKQVEASREAIGKYERDEAQPAIETAKKIADALDVT